MNQWFDAEQHAQRARAFFQAGQWKRALSEIQAALEVIPDNHEWHFGMGLTLDALKRYDEAVRCYETVLKLHGQDVETLLHLGADLIRIQQPARAIGPLRRASQLALDCEESYCYRIAAHAQLGQHDEAEVMFYLAQQIKEDCPRCFLHLANSLEMRNQTAKALWCWQQVIRIDPRMPEVSANIARIHWRQGRLAEARESYLQALRLEPGRISLLREVAALLTEMGLRLEAADKHRRILEQDPESAEAHLRLGELAMRDDHLDAAQRALDRARALDNELWGLHLRLAQVAMRRGDAATARAALLTEIKSKYRKHEPELTTDIMRLLFELGMYRHAVGRATRELKGVYTTTHETFRAEMLLFRGVAWLRLGVLPRGIADCRAALRIAPRNAVAMHNLALAYMRRQRLTQATFWLRRAQALAPDDVELKRLRRGLRWARVKALARAPWRWLLNHL